MIRGMKGGIENRQSSRLAPSAALVAWALLLAVSVKPSLAGASGQTTFPSPDDASRALVSAVQEHDERAVGKILGSGNAPISSDDKAEDALEREGFVQKFQEMHRWVRKSGGDATLYIGAENWPFPIPLVSRDGVWRFDSKAGSDEILFRRIGENEVTAIGMCGTLVTAEAHPDTSKPILFHGYYFRNLSNPEGGFAAIAYPAVYRSSGVMTFIVTQDSGVLEKDLGPNTANLAGATTAYRADATWAPAESKP